MKKTKIVILEIYLSGMAILIRIRRIFINYQEYGIRNVPDSDSDSNFFLNINIWILRYLFHVKNLCKM